VANEDYLKTRKIDITLIVLVSALLAAGCSSVQVMVEQNPDVNFDEYGTWDWFPEESSNKREPDPELAKDLREYIMSSLAAHLAERGYKQSGFSPELYVSYHVTTQDMMNSQVIMNYYGESYYPEINLGLPVYDETYDYQWEKGSLLLMVFDAKSKRLLWRGLASTDVNTQGPRKEAKERIDNAVKKLTKKLPET
jgi:hypothetical protein